MDKDHKKIKVKKKDEFFKGTNGETIEHSHCYRNHWKGFSQTTLHRKAALHAIHSKPIRIALVSSTEQRKAPSKTRRNISGIFDGMMREEGRSWRSSFTAGSV